MPFTFAHPAAVLPFSRKSKYVHFSAMVLGSMSPDFEYFIRGKPYGEIGHTFIGFLVFNLPIVIVVYLIYKTLIHKTFYSYLPSIFQETYSHKKSSSRWLIVFVFLYSALFGMFTHIVWDSFTHINGFMVRNLSILTYSIPIFHLNIPIYKFLQHGGTIVGSFSILGYMYFRAVKNRGSIGRGINLKQKWMYWCLIVLLTTMLMCFWCQFSKVSFESYGIIVVRIIDSALISLFIITIVFNYFGKKNLLGF